MRELDSSLHDKISELCEQGDSAVEEERLDQALCLFEEALKLIPEPIDDWEASTWVLTALGDTCFLKGDFEQARTHLLAATHCPDAIGNPMIHLRLGQVQLELGNTARAHDELARAYMSEGKEIFEGEDPKYLEFVLARLR